MSIATDGKPVMPAQLAARSVTGSPADGQRGAASPEGARLGPGPEADSQERTGTADAGTRTADARALRPADAGAVDAGAVDAGAVERALAAAIQDAARIGDLLEVLKTARLWLPLPDDGTPAIQGSAVTLPTVSYLGSDFVPAYSSAELLQILAGPADPANSAAIVPHLVVRAADLARLLPPSIGIALNAGASESVPVYPQGVGYLAASDDDEDDTAGRISLGPLPASLDGLLNGIRSGLRTIPRASKASAAWLSVQFAGEGLIISVTLDDPADAGVREMVVAVLERAAELAPPQDTGFPIDVTFPGEGEHDYIDEWISAFTTPFYRR